MYYESSKKNYSRYPSTISLQDHDLKYYFPEKLYAAGDTSRYEGQTTSHAVSAKNDVVIR